MPRNAGYVPGWQYQGLAIAFHAATGDDLLIALDTAQALVNTARNSPATEPQLRRSVRPGLDDPRLWQEFIDTREHRLTTELVTKLAGASGGADSASFEVWNEATPALRDLGIAHGLNLAAHSAMTDTDTHDDARARSILGKLTAVYSLDQTTRHAAWLISEGLLTPDEYRRIATTTDRLCDQLAPHALLLAEAFGYPPGIVRAPMTQADYPSALAHSLTWPDA
ncbi:acyl-CoA dehydrogenase [Kitasatospora sp. NPDC008115]|uniref:acyl-CoA dehydrogenase n=1 Tax=Kitasatospora sp. NPDC008115 TaxID=3364022 RepID=UPI0036E1F186